MGMDAAKLANAQLTMAQLRKVADYFGHSIFFFAEPGEPDEAIHSAQFRTIGKQTNLDSNLYKLIRQAEEHRDLLIHMLESAGEKLQFNPPALNGNMANKAETVRNWLGIDYALENYNFAAYRELIEEKGVFVQMSMGYRGQWKVDNPDKMLGFSLLHPVMPVIFVTKTSEPRQTFTLFHELGHLLLHSDSFFDDALNFRSSVTSCKEQEANNFAGKCFLTDEYLAGLGVPESYEKYDEAYEVVTDERGISVEVVVVALLKKGRISKKDYQNYVEYRNKMKGAIGNKDVAISRKWRHREPFHIFGARYVSAVLDSMQRGDMSLYKACKSLDNLKVSSMQKLLHGD